MRRALKLGLYFLAKVSGAFSIARRLSSKSARILCYHGGCIGDEWRYNDKLFMTRSTFEKRVDWLQAKGYEMVSLDEALSFPPNSKGRQIPVAFTFDDGWFSTGRDLLPVLFEKKIPSVLYLSTKYFKDGAPILAVTVGYILWKTVNKTIRIDGLGDSVDGIYDLETPSSRQLLIGNMHAWMTNEPRSRNDVIKALNTLALSAGIALDELALDSRRFDYLLPDEILSYAKHNCTIGLHGHLHAYPVGNPERFRDDLRLCIQAIEELKLPTPKHYCYPSGNHDDAASGVLESFGIKSGTTCTPGLIDSSRQTNKYYLPRFLDGENIHMLEFEAEMTGFAELLRRILVHKFSRRAAALFRNGFRPAASPRKHGVA